MTLFKSYTSILPIHYIELHQNDSIQMTLAQIIWWGFGLTMIYDTAEIVFHCPYIGAMVIYSSLMIISTWLNVYAMIMMTFIALPTLMVIIYLSSWGVQWIQMLNMKSIEYIGWSLLMMSSFITVKQWLSFFIFPRVPVKPTILFLGTAFFVGYDYIVLQISGQWQYVSMLVPLIAIVFRHRGVRHFSFWL